MCVRPVSMMTTVESRKLLMAREVEVQDRARVFAITHRRVARTKTPERSYARTTIASPLALAVIGET